MSFSAKQNVTILTLWLVVILSASFQVAATHWHRQLVAVWQVTERQRLSFEQDYGRLLLEQSALTAHGRVERIAKDTLQMIEAKNVQVIRSSRQL
jgi:cell division protein FtsL